MLLLLLLTLFKGRDDASQGRRMHDSCQNSRVQWHDNHVITLWLIQKIDICHLWPNGITAKCIPGNSSKTSRCSTAMKSLPTIEFTCPARTYIRQKIPQPENSDRDTRLDKFGHEIHNSRLSETNNCSGCWINGLFKVDPKTIYQCHQTVSPSLLLHLPPPPGNTTLLVEYNWRTGESDTKEEVGSDLHDSRLANGQWQLCESRLLCISSTNNYQSPLLCSLNRIGPFRLERFIRQRYEVIQFNSSLGTRKKAHGFPLLKVPEWTKIGHQARLS